MKKLFLIDAFALIFRFHYAFISNPMRNSEGLNTSAIYGFTKFINEIINKEKPEYIGVAFDPRGGNFRHKICDQYKANRSETPEDIIASIPYIKEILTKMNIPIMEVLQFEADDVIGTIAKRVAKEGIDVYMVTPDKDYGQLIEDNIKMYKPSKGGANNFEIITKDKICAKYSIDNPEKVIDILALWGDASDNVQGVPGIGEKSAIKLVSTYGDINGIYENIDKIKGKQQENLIQYKDRLMKAKELVTICLNVPIESPLEQLLYNEPKLCDLIDIYTQLNFHTFIKDLEIKCGKYSQSPILPVSSPLTPPSLFAEFDAEDANSFIPKTSDFYNNITNTQHIYTLIETQQDADLLADLIELKKEFCFDTETTGLNHILDSLVGISISLEKNKAYYIPYNENVDINKKLKPIFENPNISKIGQNIKFDILALKSVGIEVQGTLYDTMILQYIVNPDMSNGMNFMALNYFNYETIKIEELIGKGSTQKTIDQAPIEQVTDYACEDADITLQLKDVLWEKVKQIGLDSLYLNIEQPLIYVLADMEHNGVMIDRNILADYSVTLTKEANEIEQKIREYGGENININSPKQLGELLFDKLKITDKPKRTKTKQYKTDEEYLLSLKDKHDVVGLILEYRTIKKLLSTYILSLIELINPKTGRVHTHYNQALTRTGRLSSSNPNLQNIPIRTPRGEVIRRAFVAQNSSRIIVAADYSQVELRIMAHLSQDPAMIEAFNNEQDIHNATAAKIYKREINEVSKIERSNAKSANFGIIYGISVFGLSSALEISRADAKILIDGYFDSYPKVKEYMDKSIEKARECGYAETIYHRRRYLEDINSSNMTTKNFAERNAINAPIQGSAADIMKLAMISLHQKIKKNNLNSIITLQVHDELVLEVEKNELEQIISLVKESMENATKLSVPLTVDVRYAENWLEAH